jgi:hypothetical protein
MPARYDAQPNKVFFRGASRTYVETSSNDLARTANHFLKE